MFDDTLRQHGAFPRRRDRMEAAQLPDRHHIIPALAALAPMLLGGSAAASAGVGIGGLAAGGAAAAGGGLLAGGAAAAGGGGLMSGLNALFGKTGMLGSNSPLSFSGRFPIGKRGMINVGFNQNSNMMNMLSRLFPQQQNQQGQQGQQGQQAPAVAGGTGFESRAPRTETVGGNSVGGNSVGGNSALDILREMSMSQLPVLSGFDSSLSLR